jgi:hypothetical protein
MPNKAQIVLGCILVFLMLVLGGCGGDATPGPVAEPTSQPIPVATPQATVDQSTFTWQISIVGAEVKEALHTEAGVTQYDGSVATMPYDNLPSTGRVFLIVDLVVSKARPGGKAFTWDNLVARDADGNLYHRMEDDTFLASHTYSRMAGTDLKLGTNNGVICFEIPQERADEGFSLVYTSDEGETVLLLP